MSDNRYCRPLIGCTPRMEQLRRDVALVAATNLTVMIQGEPGTGKDVVAQNIHTQSNRAGGPFVKVNCAALPDDLIESELFGSERGAFTGAMFRKGKFELAHRGTIFLDEVGELAMRAQAKLLQVAETQAIDRLGGQGPIPVDFRLVVATNRDIKKMIREGTFRRDLDDRLTMDRICVPPLRERLDDIPLLVEYFINEFVAQRQRLVTGASQQVLDLFLQYSWPGNVRELQNVIRNAVWKGQSELIRREDLPFDFAQSLAATPLKIGNHDETIKAVSRQLIVGALAQCGDNRTQAMKVLCLSRKRFYKYLKMHGLDGEPPNGSQETDWIDD